MSLMFRRALYAKGSQHKVLNNFKRNTVEHKLEQPNCAI